MHEFPQKWGKYILLDHLASGGMAEIFIALQAHDLKGQRLVVIKRIRGGKENRDEMLKLFQIEAQVLLSLQSPYVVHTYDFEMNENNEPYLVMEFIEGLNLKRSKEMLSVAGIKTFPLDVALEIIKQAATALTAAHDCRNSLNGEKSSILHRDISPQNIVLSTTGYTKVIDFGVAKAESFGSATLFEGQIKGKVNYMSPEQYASQEKLDGRTDIFSLGIVFWELLSGEKFFKNSEINEELSIEKFIHGRYNHKSLREYNSAVDSELESFISKMIEVKRELRPENAAEVSNGIANYQNSKKLSQGPELLKEFLANNLGEPLAHERRRIQLLIEKSKNTPLKENVNSREASPFKSLPRKKHIHRKYIAASISVFSIAFLSLFYFIHQNRKDNIATSTPQVENRRPSSQLAKDGTRTLGIPSDDQVNLRFVMKWSFEMKQKASEEVIQKWNNVYNFEAKTNDPRPYIESFKSMNESIRHTSISNLKTFIENFDSLKSDAEKIELIEKYKKDINLLPPPRRNSNN